jgi:hypothetical protein
VLFYNETFHLAYLRHFHDGDRTPSRLFAPILPEAELSLKFECAYGGFTEDGTEYLISTPLTPRPYQ